MNYEEESFNGFTINSYGTWIGRDRERYYNRQKYHGHAAKSFERTGLYGQQ